MSLLEDNVWGSGEAHLVRSISACLALALCLVVCGCGGGGSSFTPAVIPAISGQWEFLASSTTNVGQQSYVEANLQEGQKIASGVYVPNGQLSATGSQQIAVLTVDSAGNVVFSGGCPGAGLSSLTGTVDANYNVNINYSENGNNFAATGALSSDHKTIMGTYSSQASGCVDTGTFIGTALPKLSGLFVGTVCSPLVSSCQYPQQATDDAMASVSQSGSSVKVSFVLTGADNTSFSLSGPITGNAFVLQGTFQGQAVTYYGYYELTYDCLTQLIDLPSLYLVSPANVGVGNQFGQVALLTMPLSQSCPAR